MSLELIRYPEACNVMATAAEVTDVPLFSPPTWPAIFPRTAEGLQLRGQPSCESDPATGLPEAAEAPDEHGIERQRGRPVQEAVQPLVVAGERQPQAVADGPLLGR